MKIENILEQTLLYDFYGELLTDHQKRIYDREEEQKTDECSKC